MYLKRNFSYNITITFLYSDAVIVIKNLNINMGT